MSSSRRSTGGSDESMNLHHWRDDHGCKERTEKGCEEGRKEGHTQSRKEASLGALMLRKGSRRSRRLLFVWEHPRWRRVRPHHPVQAKEVQRVRLLSVQSAQV